MKTEQQRRIQTLETGEEKTQAGWLGGGGAEKTI